MGLGPYSSNLKKAEVFDAQCFDCKHETTFLNNFNLSDKQLLQIIRLSVVFVVTCSALLAAYEGNIYDLVGQSSALSLVSLFASLTFGLYWKRASDAGALSSIIVGMAVWIYFEFIQSIDIPSLILGGLASLFAMIVVSSVWPDNSDEDFKASLLSGEIRSS